MDELKQQDEEHKLNQETSAAGKSVSNVDPRSWEDDEPEIPEESRPNLTDLFESIPDDDKKSDNIKFENLVTDNKFTALREFAVEKVSEFGENLIQGKIPAQPVDMDKACKNCAYKNICANPYPDNAIDSTDSEYAKKLLEKIENKETEENNNEC